MSRKRVVLAMSGGVDSSVAAHVLVEQGYDVIGLFMRTGTHGAPSNSRKTRGCCSAVDAADARLVADRLDIPFYALNFQEDFDRIKDYFADEYAAGRTPNPCVVCNTWLKFGKLWDYAESVQADFIATGHYARVDRNEGSLHRAVDDAKDQSYFLFGISRDMLRRIIFPIGEWTKAEVRERAGAYGLNVALKPESQEICFVPTGNYQDFLAEHRPESVSQPGNIVDIEGNALASHPGISHFTIGQRKGMGVGFGEPRYVVALKPELNQVVIGPRELLAQTELIGERANWLSELPAYPIRCQVKIRYHHRPASASVEADTTGKVRVSFDEPQSAITPGQAVVFYEDSRVLGGAWIA